MTKLEILEKINKNNITFSLGFLSKNQKWNNEKGVVLAVVNKRGMLYNILQMN